MDTGIDTHLFDGSGWFLTQLDSKEFVHNKASASGLCPFQMREATSFPTKPYRSAIHGVVLLQDKRLGAFIILNRVHYNVIQDLMFIIYFDLVCARTSVYY